MPIEFDGTPEKDIESSQQDYDLSQFEVAPYQGISDTYAEAIITDAILAEKAWKFYAFSLKTGLLICDGDDANEIQIKVLQELEEKHYGARIVFIEHEHDPNKPDKVIFYELKYVPIPGQPENLAFQFFTSSENKVYPRVTSEIRRNHKGKLCAFSDRDGSLVASGESIEEVYKNLKSKLIFGCSFLIP